MKNPDLLAVMNEAKEAADRGREAVQEFYKDGREANKKKFDAAHAELAAVVIVDYTRQVRSVLPGTDLLVVPPVPLGISAENLKLPEGFEWPEGMVVGSLATDSARKAAVKAMIAHMTLAYDHAILANRTDGREAKLHSDVVSMGQSFLKAEALEITIDGAAGSAQHSDDRRAPWDDGAPVHDDSDF